MLNLVELEPIPYERSIEGRDGVADNGHYEHITEKLDIDPEKYEISDDSRHVDKINSYRPILIYSIIISTGGFLFGYDIGTIGGLLDFPLFINKFGDNLTTSPPSFNSLTKGALISIAGLGGCIGGLATTKLITKLGCIGTIFVASLSYAMGNAITCMSKSWQLVLLGRIFNGLSIGTICVTCPMLISDLAPTQRRGFFISLHQLMTTVGILIGACTLYLSSNIFLFTNDLQFIYPLVQGIFFALITCASIWIVPESPNWYITSSRSIEKAKKSLSQVRNLPLSDPDIINAVSRILDYYSQHDVQHNGHHAHESQNKSIIRGKPSYLLRTFTGVGLLCFQQLTGINYFFFFGTSIFKSIGFDNPYIVPIFFGAVNLIFSLISMITISKFKRTHLLIFGSSALLCLMLIFSTIGLALPKSSTAGYIMVGTSCAFIGVFALSWGPLASVVVSELYPPSIKVKAMSISGSSSWIATLLVSFMIPVVSSWIGFGLGYIFSFFQILSLAFVFFVVPETKDVTNAKLDDYYEKNSYRFTKH